MNHKRALVTGGAGFIGSHLVDKLLERDYEVFVVDNLRSGSKNNIEHHFTNEKFWFEEISIAGEKIKQVFQIYRPEVIFHLAAVPNVSFSVENPFLTNETNVGGTVKLLELAKKYESRRIIFSSSSSVYGGIAPLPTPEYSELNPKSPYALQKYIAEQYLKLFYEQYGIDSAVLRYFNIFGPRQVGSSPYSSVISSFLHCKKYGKKAKIYGDGEQFRDFSYVDNAVYANILAAESAEDLKAEAFNVACGGKTSVNDLKKIIGIENIEYLDNRPGDIKKSMADISKAKEILGYDILVPFEKGMKKTIEWYLSGE